MASCLDDHTFPSIIDSGASYHMTGDQNRKRRFVTCNKEDRMSNLPNHLIGLILERLPVEDAAKTSMSSSQWRNFFNFNIKARDLDILSVNACFDAMLLRLMDNPCLSMVSICFGKPIEDYVRLEGMNLTRMLSILPKLRSLVIDGHFLKFLCADQVPKWLPSAIDSLRYFRLHDFRISDLDQLQGALCLLRNSPNLETLRLSCMLEARHYDVRPASEHLKSPDCLDQTLNQLRTVEITALKGSRPELLFIKLLLARSPSLDEMTIHLSGTIDASKRLKNVVDVMRFPRASTKAEVIFS